MVHVFTENLTQTQAFITGPDVNHLKNVLRMQTGDDIYVSDGKGRNVLCSIAQISDEEIVADIIRENAADTELPVGIVLYQGLPKSDKMEWIIQKCVELGAVRIVPVETARCVVKLDARGRDKKVERWQKIAESAAKQSQRGVIPKISPVMSLNEAIEDAERLSKGILAYEDSTDRQGLKKLLVDTGELKYESLGIFIGPEGGWTPEEVEKITASGIECISLGHRILRTETAGMSLIAALMLEIEARADKAETSKNEPQNLETSNPGGIKHGLSDLQGGLKLLAVMALAGLLAIGSPDKAWATMSLETGASVSGISIALNNLYARNLKPEKALADSVKRVANGSVVIDQEKPNVATQKLVESTEVKQEEIVTQNGTTYGTVHGTKSLRLRNNPSQDAKTVTLLAEGESYVVVGQEGDFLKVKVDEDLEGWVFKDYIETETKLDSEITEEEKAKKAEEAEKLKKEAEEALKKLEEAKEAEEKSKTKETTESQETEKAKETTAAKETVEAMTKAKETEKSTEAETKETVEALVTEAGEDLVEIDTPEEETEAKETKAETEKATEQETVEIGPGSSGSSVSSATRNAMVAYAKQFIGNPYVYGGTDLYNGIDCSAFTQAIYKNFGYTIGRSSRDQAAQSKTIDASSAQPGDLFFYDSSGTINHVAMYIGNGQVIHASSAATGIKISNAYYRTPCKVGRIIN